ncbi:MAG TPA: Calx-beta domain-containing protein, partial [Geminicoccaceae bacterium]|nr:Calx-beta domain-containing protein [Geminicoccaceae bacterium]
MAGYLAISDAIIGEGDEKATFIVTLFGAAPSETVTVSYGTIELTADGTDDYSGIAFGQLTFSPGETSKTIVVDINNDSIQEQTEYFSVRLVNNSANSIITKEIGIGMLYDDDTQTADLPYIQTDNYVINEIDRFVDVVVRLSSVSSKAITVNYATVADTAASGQDFTIRSGTLTFAAGETVKTIRVNVRNDGIFEPEERFFFDLSNASNAIVADARAEIRIAGHSQLQALPLISVSDIILDESAGLARFEVSLSSPTNNLVTVLSQIGPGSIGQGDILNTMGSSSSVRQLVFEPGETIKTIDIVIGDDQSIEQLETFFVSLSNASNASIAKSIGLGSIVDNDFISADGPYLTIENTVVDEHAGTAEVLVRMSAVATQTVSVDYATVGGTGRPGLDFGGVHGTLIFLPGETLQKIRIDLVDDTRPELEEMFQILLSNARNATIGHDLGEVWIVGDTAEQPTAYLRVDNLTIGEGDGLARFELSLSAPIAEPVTVTYFAGPQAGQIDYALSNTFGITTFMPGETVKTIALNIIDDRLIEGTEVFAFQIGSSNSNVTVVEPISILTIVDNDTDSLGDSYIVMDDIVVNEQNGHAQVTVHLTKPSNDIIKVDYHTINGSARAGSDYIDRSGELMFMPGETAKTVRLGLIDDAEAEGNEHLFLQLTSAEGAVLAEDIAAIRIANNDGRSDGLPTISIGDVTVSEGDKVARFEVTLSSASIDTVSYRLALAGTTAGLGTDFGHPLGSSVFAPGETVKIVTVGIGDDTLREATEAFEVRLSNVSNARIGDALGIGTIVDNDTSTPAGPRITGSNI